MHKLPVKDVKQNVYKYIKFTSLKNDNKQVQESCAIATITAQCAYTRVPWKFSGLPDYAQGYYSQHFTWAFAPIDPVNGPTIFEVRRFTSSWDNRGYPQNLDSPWICPRPIFS